MKIFLLFLLAPIMASSQKYNAYAGGAANCYTGKISTSVNAGVSRFFGHKLSLGINADGYVFDKTKFAATKADFSLFISGAGQSSVFTSAEPGWTIYNNGNTKGDFAGDAMVGAKLLTKGPAIYVGIGYVYTSFKTGDFISRNQGFKLRLGIGI